MNGRNYEERKRVNLRLKKGKILNHQLRRRQKRKKNIGKQNIHGKH